MEPIIGKEGVTFKGDAGQETFARFTTQHRGQNFQHFQNQAGQFIALGKDHASLYGQSLANVGFNPISAGDVAPKSVIGIDESKNQISQGSDGPRDNVTAMNNELAGIESGANDGVDTGDVDYGAELENVRSDFANLTSFSSAELKDIREQAEAEQSELFDPLIAEAEERKRLGRAKNLVSTGRRGGMQRARYVGDEVFPSEFGAGKGIAQYEGAGGKLQEAAAAFERNIQKLRVQKARAITLAKAAAKKATISARRQDLDMALKIFNEARKIDAASKELEQQDWENKFKMKQADRMQTTADFNIIKNIPFGESVTVGDRIFTGIHKENIEPFWTSASVVAIMKNLPIGETDELKDPITGAMIPIIGLKSEDINTQIFRSVNKNNGTETYTTIDKNTGEPIKQWKSVGTGETFKIKSGGDGGDDDKEKNKFFTELNSASNRLRAGATWGQTFNTLFAKYKTGDPAQDQALTQLIDSSLDKDFWSQEGAYQQFKSSTRTKTVVSVVFNEDNTRTTVYSDGSRETF